MKKLIIGVVVTIVLVGGMLFALRNININRINTNHFYVQITEDGVKTEEKLSSGEIFIQYEYSLDGYNKKGDKQKLDFTAAKQLRKDAYLQLFVNDENTVKSYQEVKLEEIPEKAQLKYKK